MIFDFFLDICVLLLWLLIPSITVSNFYSGIEKKEEFSTVNFSIIYNFQINVEEEITEKDFDENCSLTIVVLSKNRNFFDLPHFNSKKCRISEKYFYVHSGAGREIDTNLLYEADSKINDTKIVRVYGIDSGNLFGFALSIYYPSTYVSIIDIDKIFNTQSINTYIDRSINKLRNGIEISFSNPKEPFAIVAFQYAIRRFILYTDIKYSDISALSILYDVYKCRYQNKYVINENDNNKNFNDCDKIPKEWKCESETNSTNVTFAVLIPTFKRNYLSRSINMLNIQKEKPNQIIIVQNRMHTTFDFKILDNITNIPIRHLWCTNWNSYFYLTYSFMMLIEDKYFIKIDDDYFFNSPFETEKLFKFAIENPNSMGGVGNRIQRSINCNCHIIASNYDRSNVADFISLVAIMYSSSGKILHRFAALSYKTAEDVSVGLTNAIECNTKSLSINGITGVYVGTEDGMTHTKDKDFNKDLINRLWKQTNCHYIYYGYHPVSWRTYKCTDKNNDIRYPH